MLKRISGALFEAPAGAELRVVARSQANNGVEDARFEYAGAVLDREAIQGLPGCRFVVDEARRRLQAIVVFDPAADGTARYDLFEVEPDGGLTDLNETVMKSDSSPLIDFVIAGVAVPAVAGMAGAGRPATAARPVRRVAAKRSASSRRKKSAAKTRRASSRRGGKTGAGRTARRAKTTRTPTTRRKRPAAKKKTARKRTRGRTRS